MKTAKFFKFYLSHPSRILQQLRYRRFLRKNPGVPWMAPQVITFLDRTITPHFQLLEWGSGGSTAWFAKRAGKVTSIESNIDWYEKVKARLGEEKLDVDYRLITADESRDQNELIESGQIPPYVSVIADFGKNHFDMVIVDGCFRNVCIHEAKKYLKSGGYLVLDNSNWMPADVWGIPAEWKLVSHHDVGVSCTSVWVKP